MKPYARRRHRDMHHLYKRAGAAARMNYSASALHTFPAELSPEVFLGYIMPSGGRGGGGGGGGLKLYSKSINLVLPMYGED